MGQGDIEEWLDAHKGLFDVKAIAEGLGLSLNSVTTAMRKLRKRNDISYRLEKCPSGVFKYVYGSKKWEG